MSDRAPTTIVGWLLTPSWSLGLTLFCCLFLPSYQGCNGRPISVYQALDLRSPDPHELYVKFHLCWPFAFGFIVALGCGWLLWRGDPQQAKLLWLCFAVLIAVHTSLLIAFLVVLPPEELSLDDAEEALAVGAWLFVSASLVVLIPITGMHCRTWFNAALWMQLSLSLAAVVSVSFIVPSLLLANRLLLGGKLMVFCSVFLVVSTVLQRLDGYRAITRVEGQSPFQLSLRSLLMMSLLSGLACAWIGRILLSFG